MKRDMTPVLDRFVDKDYAVIDCDEGWHSLILELDVELAEIDPDYSVIQVKQKFGSLRYYYTTKTKRDKLMNHIIRAYEKLAEETCEISGKPGVLMSRNGVYKTLSIEHAPEGYKPMHRIKGRPGDEHPEIVESRQQ